MRAVLAIATLAIAAPAMSQSGGGAFTVVETGQRFAHLQEAVTAIDSRQGTIRIAPGTYYECAVQGAGRIAFIAEIPGKTIFERTMCEDKAALVLRGGGASVEGLVFTRMLVGDGNGAGIRLEKGDLAVKDTMFVDGQSGILSADDPTSKITIDHATFAGLGKDPTGHGAHGIYIGDYASLTVTNSRFERGTGGHYLKSRAKQTTVLDSSFDDTAGRTTNYMIDLSNGSRGRISGNEFVGGPNKENYSTMVTVAPEGAHYPSEGLQITNNRASLAPGVGYTTAFVGNWSGEKIVIAGNRLGKGITEVKNHWF